VLGAQAPEREMFSISKDLHFYIRPNFVLMNTLLPTREMLNGKGFSEHLHRLYRWNLTYHRALIVKFATNLEEMSEMSRLSDNGPAVFMKES
jgi:hypothetical protein